MSDITAVHNCIYCARLYRVCKLMAQNDAKRN